MAVFNKTDMRYSHYKWTAYPNDDPKITGEPDRTLFNRNEGYEVLYLINHIVNTKSDGLKAERMIHNHLPSNIRTQIDVKKWIKDNWNSYN